MQSGPMQLEQAGEPYQLARPHLGGHLKAYQLDAGLGWLLGCWRVSMAVRAIVWVSGSVSLRVCVAFDRSRPAPPLIGVVCGELLQAGSLGEVGAPQSFTNNDKSMASTATASALVVRPLAVTSQVRVG